MQGKMRAVPNGRDQAGIFIMPQVSARNLADHSIVPQQSHLRKPRPAEKHGDHLPRKAGLRGQPCLTTANDWSLGSCLRPTVTARVAEPVHSLHSRKHCPLDAQSPEHVPEQRPWNPVMRCVQIPSYSRVHIMRSAGCAAGHPSSPPKTTTWAEVTQIAGRPSGGQVL